MKTNMMISNVYLEANLVKIEIYNEEKRKNFINNYITELKNKYPEFNFIILENKYTIELNNKKYKIFNINNIKKDNEIETIAIVNNYSIENIRGNFKYKISLDNFFSPTSINCLYFNSNKINIKPNDIVKIKGIVKEIPLNEDNRYLAHYIELDSVEIIKKENTNIFEQYKTKRNVLTMQSKLSNGFIDKFMIDRYDNKIENYCFTDYNTLNFLEKDNNPLCLKCYFEAYNNKKYSIYLFVNAYDEEIDYEEQKIKVNPAIRALNEMISNCKYYKDKYVIDYDTLIKYKDLFLLGSLDNEGLVFQALLDNDYNLLAQYIDMFNILGIEPLGNLKHIQKEGRLNSGLNNLKKLNNKIKKIGILKGIPTIFADNPIVINKEDREIAREYIINERIKDEKNKNNIILSLRKDINIDEISFVRSIPEIIEELKLQGFNLKDIQNIIFNEIVFYSSLIKKDNITIIPDIAFLEKSMKQNKQLKESLLQSIHKEHKVGKYAERLNKEFKIITDKKYAKIFLAALAVIKLSKEYKHPVSERGTASNMLITHELGISSIDPVEYNLDYRMFLGEHAEKMPDIDINVSKTIIKEVIDEMKKYFNNTIKASITTKAKELYIKQFLNRINSHVELEYASNLLSNKYLRLQEHNSGIMLLPEKIDINYIFPRVKYNDEYICGYPYEFLENNIPKIDILSKNDLDILKDIELLIPLNQIDLNSNEIYELITTNNKNISELNTDYAKKIIDVINPKCFNDLVKIQGLLHGRGVFSSAQYSKKNNLFIISSREDLLKLLNHFKINNSFTIMEMIRKGKYNKLNEEQNKEIIEKIPQEYINIISKIEYLFPKSHAIAYAKQACYSAYYQIHKKEIEKIKEDIKVIGEDNGISIEEMEEFLTED